MDISKCRHCGGVAKIESTRKHRRVTAFFVECKGCGIRTPAFGSYITAVAIWNRRPDDVLPEGLQSVIRYNKGA